MAWRLTHLIKLWHLCFLALAFLNIAIKLLGLMVGGIVK